VKPPGRRLLDNALNRSLYARPESSEESGQRKLWWIQGG
jgi:hypothetical protein